MNFLGWVCYNVPMDEILFKPPKRKQGELRALIVANATSRAPLRWQDFSEKHKIKRGTVYSKLRDLRARGILSPARLFEPPVDNATGLGLPHDPIHTKMTPFNHQNPPRGLGANLTEMLSNLDARDPEHRRQILALIAANSTDGNKMGAVAKLEEFDNKAGNRIGPPEPQSDEQYAERLGRMIYAAGPHRTQLAINFAAKLKEAEIAPTPEAPLGPDGHENGPSTGHGPESSPSAPIS